MDLSRMTRDELEREATRRGVREVTHLTRAELIRAIEAPPVAGAIDTAKAIFRGVLGVARTLRGRPSSPPPPAPAPARAHSPSAAAAPRDSAAQPVAEPAAPGPARESARPAPAEDDTARLRASVASPPPAVDSRPPDASADEPPAPLPGVDEPEPRPTRGRTEDTRKMKLPTSEGESGVIDVPAGFADALAQGAAGARRDTAVTMDLGPLRNEILLAAGEGDALAKAARRRELATTVPIRPPLERDERALPEVSTRELRPLEGEPIPTRTMARLLHEQGHHRRALAILESLAAQRPGDPELDADLASVRRALGAGRTPVESGHEPAPAARAELVTLLLPDKRVLLAWGLSEESLASARNVGASGTLVARVLVLAPGSSGAVGRTLTDKDVEPSGEWAIGPIALGSFVTAAVGFRDGEHFVSVAAAPVLDVT